MKLQRKILKLIGTIFMEEYGIDLNNGVSCCKAIPFGGGSGGPSI